MSVTEPIFGIDVSHWNQDVDMSRAKAEGFEFAIVKATEGPYRDGSVYTDPEYYRHTANAIEAGMVVGAYHFLVNTRVDKQVEHFLSVVTQREEKILMVDFEPYPGYPSLTPKHEQLDAFCDQLRAATGRHPLVIYSGLGMWQNSEAGGFGNYDADATWDAYYPRGDKVAENPQRFYRQIYRYGWGERWGGIEPLMWQFTPAGTVAGRNLDVNAFRGTREQLEGLAKGGFMP